MCLAVPLKLLEVSADRGEGVVAMAGSTITVGLALVPEARPGDYVLIHAGMAIEVLQEGEAAQVLQTFQEYAHAPGLLAPADESSHD